MESVLVAIIWIGLFIIGPPAALFWMVRRRRRREREAREAAVARETAASAASATAGTGNAALPVPTAPAEPTEPTAPAAPANAAPRRRGYSYPYGVPLVIYPLLAIALATVQRTWLAILLELLLLALSGVFTFEAFSRKSFEQVRTNDPSMNRLSWRINWLVFFALPPGLLALFGLGRFLSG